MFLVSAGRSFPANSVNQTKISANNRMKIEQRFYISIIQFSVSYQGSDKFIFSWIKEKVKIDLTRNVVDNLGNCTIILFWQRYLYKGSFKYSVAVPQTIWNALSRHSDCFPATSFCQNTIDNFSHWIKRQLFKVKSVVSCLPLVKYLGYIFEVTFLWKMSRFTIWLLVKSLFRNNHANRF